MHRKQISIGDSDFKSLVLRDKLIIDRTGIIKDVIDSKYQVNILLRPRNFCKTSALTLLKHFFSISDSETKTIFKPFEIGNNKAILEKQGTYPVIFISLLRLSSCENINDVIIMLEYILGNLYDEYSNVLLKSPELSISDKHNFKAILDSKADINLLKTGLFDLSKYLFQHFKQKVILLMDEFDAQYNSLDRNGYTMDPLKKESKDHINKFLETIFTNTFQDNAYLEKAVITGIMNGIFPVLDNVKVVSVLDEEFSSYFAFSEDNVRYLLQGSNIATTNENLNEIKTNYCGYQFGANKMINPCDVLNYIAKYEYYGALFENYWENDAIYHLENLFNNLSDEVKSNIIPLLKNGYLDLNSPSIKNQFQCISLEKMNNKLDTLLVFLTLIGYLSVRLIDQQSCRFFIPNNEILSAFQRLSARIKYLDGIYIKPINLLNEIKISEITHSTLYPKNLNNQQPKLIKSGEVALHDFDKKPS